MGLCLKTLYSANALSAGSVLGRAEGGDDMTEEEKKAVPTRPGFFPMWQLHHGTSGKRRFALQRESDVVSNSKEGPSGVSPNIGCSIWSIDEALRPQATPHPTVAERGELCPICGVPCACARLLFCADGASSRLPLFLNRLVCSHTSTCDRVRQI